MLICLKLPTIKDGISLGRREFCFEIPVWVDREWKYPPQWSLRLFLDERPFEFAEDLQTLATIANLIPGLRPEFGTILSAGLEQVLSALKRQLPEGVDLKLQEGARCEEHAG